jgi:Xaa-Pro dipeptidase
MNINEIQKYLVKDHLDGWLLADFHGRNDIAMTVLDLQGMVSRRSFYFIPATGTPVALAHYVERAKFNHVEGKVIPYSGYKQLESELKTLLSGLKKVAMEYSPNGRLPYIGLVDAGTIELIRSFGVEIQTSADLVANFQARLTSQQVTAQKEAAKNVVKIMGAAWDFIAVRLKSSKKVTEWDVCRFILDQFEQHDMETESEPNCSVDAHAADPHYQPTSEKSSEIKKGQLILIDMWARHKHAHGAYADITQMAFAGKKEDIPEEYARAFAVASAARDRAVEFLKEHIPNRTVYGYEVDDACRQVIIDVGLGDHFTHRTGHSIAGSVHGAGPNIDNLETEDRRALQEGHLFSIEPGVYFDHFGLRTEINVLIGPDGPEVTTLPLQTEIRALL